MAGMSKGPMWLVVHGTTGSFHATSLCSTLTCESSAVVLHCSAGTGVAWLLGVQVHGHPLSCRMLLVEWCMSLAAVILPCCSLMSPCRRERGPVRGSWRHSDHYNCTGHACPRGWRGDGWSQCSRKPFERQRYAGVWGDVLCRGVTYSGTWCYMDALDACVW